MFIAVTKEIFEWFSRGKEYELRAVRRRFIEKTVTKGKIVTISEGYSGRRFRAEITDVVFSKSIEGIFKKVPFGKINPIAKTKNEALQVAKATCGHGLAYAAMRLKILKSD